MDDVVNMLSAHDTKKGYAAKQLSVDDLYAEDSGEYWYTSGFNWRAFAAMAVGIAPCLPGADFIPVRGSGHRGHHHHGNITEDVFGPTIATAMLGDSVGGGLGGESSGSTVSSSSIRSGYFGYGSVGDGGGGSSIGMLQAVTAEHKLGWSLVYGRYSSTSGVC